MRALGMAGLLACTALVLMAGGCPESQRDRYQQAPMDQQQRQQRGMQQQQRQQPRTQQQRQQPRTQPQQPDQPGQYQQQ